MILEQEVKLQLESDSKLDLSSLTWLNDLAEGDIETQRLISIYYDTDDQDLMKNGVGLRLRNKGGQWLQTVKTSGSAENGLHQRQEWEDILEKDEFDLEKLKCTPLKDLIEDQFVWSNIQAIFTTDFIRETVRITLAENTEIEFAYDYGKVTASQSSAKIHEIEMELKSGAITQMTAFASEVAQQLNLKASDCSKAQLGYQLIAGD